eukprot:jgi/Bigna1/131193/aug1.13_g5901
MLESRRRERRKKKGHDDDHHYDKEEETGEIHPQDPEEMLRSKFIGQYFVKSRIIHFLHNSKNGRRLVRGPSVFLFTGPPGVGKTYLAKLIATALEREIFQYDMATYKTAEDVDSFVSPRLGPSYIY